MQRILVIIPALNEANSIRSVISTIETLYPKFDIAVIDDGSTDETANEVRKTKSVLIRHPFNLGYGSSLQTGYLYGLQSGYDYLVQIDGDGQHEPSDISTLVSEVMNEQAEIVFGSRFLTKKQYKSPFFRSTGVILFRVLVRLLSGAVVSDPTTGYQAMNRKVMELFCSDSFPVDYPDADVIIMLSMHKIRFNELPVTMYENRNGKSMHTGFFHSIYYVFKLVVSMLLTRFRRTPQ